MNQSLSVELSQVMPFALATGLFTSTASFYAPVQTQGATGNSIGGTAAIAGLQNIPCMNAPRSSGPGAVSSQEKREVPYIQADRSRHVLLNAYYPQLDTNPTRGAAVGWQCVITDQNGVSNTYIFQGGEGDSQQTQSRVSLELVVI
jgi:hypothetical protein